MRVDNIWLIDTYKFSKFWDITQITKQPFADYRKEIYFYPTLDKRLALSLYQCCNTGVTAADKQHLQHNLPP